MIVAIDGPSGSGKSSVAKAVASRLGFTYLDTGAMYRSLALMCLQENIDPSDDSAVAKRTEHLSVDFLFIDGNQHVFADGKDVTSEIRTAEVEQAVSPVSANYKVRTIMVEKQRAWGQDLSKGVVVEGRDIGTAVFPKAELKIFLTAEASVRAYRRAVQRAGGDVATGPLVDPKPDEQEKILADLKRRDTYDSTRKVTPLRAAQDAIHIDSSTLSFDEVVARIIELVHTIADQSTPSTNPKTQAELEVQGHIPSQTHHEVQSQPKPQSNPQAEPEPEPKTNLSQKASVLGKIDTYFALPLKEFPLLMRAFNRIAIAVAWGFTKIFWHWSIKDKEKLTHALTTKDSCLNDITINKTPQVGRVIIMNHVSMLDPVCLVSALRLSGRVPRSIFKSEFLKNTCVAWLFASLGGIPVERGKTDLRCVRRAVAALKRGEDLVIFPEGTRIKSDDEPVEIHGGYALIAQMAGAPVVPVAIVGARDISPRGARFPRLFKRVYLAAGNPIMWDDPSLLEGQKDSKRPSKKVAVRAMEALGMKHVYELRDTLRAEHPSKH